MKTSAYLVALLALGSLASSGCVAPVEDDDTVSTVDSDQVASVSWSGCNKLYGSPYRTRLLINIAGANATGFSAYTMTATMKNSAGTTFTYSGTGVRGINTTSGIFSMYYIGRSGSGSSLSEIYHVYWNDQTSSAGLRTTQSASASANSTFTAAPYFFNAPTYQTKCPG